MQSNLIIGIIVSVGILSLVLIPKMNITNFSNPKNELKIISFTTDKELYHSNEPMNITLEISSSNKIDNVTVKVFGIKDRRNNHRINSLEIVNLNSGINTFTYSYTTPSCYGCAGISTGEHDITAIVSCQEINLNSTIKVNIEK